MGVINASPIRDRRKPHGCRRKLAVVIVLSITVACVYFALCGQESSAYESSSLLNLLPTIQEDLSTSSIQKRNISSAYPPLSCSQVLKQYQIGNATDPNNGKLFVRHTLTNPAFWISFHNANYDHVRFSTFEYGYYYEKILSAAFEEVLSETLPNGRSKHRVIDVGGNIGWFSLLAAANGAEVSTFEPNPDNTLRTCESMRLNGWLPCSSVTGGCLFPGEPHADEFQSSIHIYPYGVSDKEGDLFFEKDDINPGGSKVVHYQTNETKALRVVSLDYLAKELGWLDSDISIIKVDVEGAELDVFRGSTELLRSKRVLNLFMEGGGHFQMVQRRFKQVISILLDNGYDIHKIGGYRGPTSPINPAPTGTSIEDHIFETCIKSGRKNKKCNLWWKPRS